MIKTVFKRLARLLCGDYAAYYIYRQQASAAVAASQPLDPAVVEITQAAIAGLTDSGLAGESGYAGAGCHAYCLMLDGLPAGLCFYWHGERYASRGFWPLASGQAKLVQIVTAPQARGRGVATRLIAESARRMAAMGWQVLYARVWHSHSTSWRAFERAGWQRVALVLELNPLRRQTPLRLRLPNRLGP